MNDSIEIWKDVKMVIVLSLSVMGSDLFVGGVFDLIDLFKFY